MCLTFSKKTASALSFKKAKKKSKLPNLGSNEIIMNSTATPIRKQKTFLTILSLRMKDPPKR